MRRPQTSGPAGRSAAAVRAGAAGWSQAQEALAQGQVVAVPTDTVFGLAARVDRPDAVHEIFALKGRPARLALPVIVADGMQARGLSNHWAPAVQRLTSALWPGALTVVVDAPEPLARLLGSDDGSVGLRCPAQDALRELCRQVGPLAVTSANLHGQPPCTSAAEVLVAFAGPRGERIAVVVDDGSGGGVPSTVVDCRGPTPAVLRAGAVAWSLVQEAWAGRPHGTGHSSQAR